MKTNIQTVLSAAHSVQRIFNEEEQMRKLTDLSGSKEEIKAQLREAYAKDEILVNEDQLDRGVQESMDKRFTYTPPQPNFSRRLADIYITKERWMRKSTEFFVTGLISTMVLSFVIFIFHSMSSARERMDRGNAIQYVHDGATLIRETIEYVNTHDVASASGDTRLIKIESNFKEKADSLKQSIKSSGEPLLEQGRSILKKKEDDITVDECNKWEESFKKISFNSTRNDLTKTIDTSKEVYAQYDQFKTVTTLIKSNFKVDDPIHKSALSISDEFMKLLADGNLEEAKVKFDELKNLGTQRENQLKFPIRIEELRASALLLSKDEIANKQVNELANEAQDKLKIASPDSVDVAKKNMEKIQKISDKLLQEFNLLIPRSDKRSGFYRIGSATNSSQRFYVVVEAFDDNGKAQKLVIEDEEDGNTKYVREWGERVSEEFYNKLKEEKTTTGIIANPIFGVKKKGYISIDYTQGPKIGKPEGQDWGRVLIDNK